MNRKREAVFMGLGILAGLALSGPAVQATTSITATLSSQPIYVDGQRISMTAYNISGNNYVRLRDIGSAVDFGVTYDAATNSVYIDSAQPYRGGTPRRIPRAHGRKCADYLGAVEASLSHGHSLRRVLSSQ